MKKFFLLLSLSLTGICAFAQQSDDYLRLKLLRRENLCVKEWNTDARTRTKWLDRITTYNERGEKLEEIEYNKYGQAWRMTYEYDAEGHIISDRRYNEKDKVTEIRKYEYNPDGTKKKQYKYSPKGKLLTVKVFEYIKEKQ